MGLLGGDGGWSWVLSQGRGSPKRSLNAVGSWFWDMAGRSPGDTGPIPASGALSNCWCNLQGWGFGEPCVE